MKIRYTLFLTLGAGGYARMFEAVDHPGITGVISRKTKNQPEKREIYFKGETYEKPSEAIAAWEAHKDLNPQT